ncbi:winged helix-turn-helix transcriptional regulator [Halococcus saccharolyticus]|uniref:Transcriptional regulator, HxlR family protein n=1 Tax=Halococcus saccharolyticus DSM 5350 TaxID=1227455 RepID=M0MHL0_9EURY|nr:helix-turn-helix domain-containing protein [Halococcus saccharolyticus]EMA44184.1 transcriptional regulator, HxlR family protein [Halococcus saccharolyticus DSM 5350]
MNEKSPERAAIEPPESATEESSEWRAVWHGLHQALRGKWAMHVLRLLFEGPRGFNEMRRELDGPTAKTLSERLTELRCHGLVERHVEATSPPSTRYELTPAGRRFVAVLRELEVEVDLVECGCAEECEVATVDAERTAAATEECC